MRAKLKLNLPFKKPYSLVVVDDKPLTREAKLTKEIYDLYDELTDLRIDGWGLNDRVVRYFDRNSKREASPKIVSAIKGLQTVENYVDQFVNGIETDQTVKNINDQMSALIPYVERVASLASSTADANLQADLRKYKERLDHFKESAVNAIKQNPVKS